MDDCQYHSERMITDYNSGLCFSRFVECRDRESLIKARARRLEGEEADATGVGDMILTDKW